MKKTVFVLIAIMLSIVTNGYGQAKQLLKVYYDGPGAGFRKLEEARLEDWRKEKSRTLLNYSSTFPTSQAEKTYSKTRIIFNPFASATINYDDYKNVCSSYLNPFKRATCNNKYKYLINAHSKVMNLLLIPPSNKINKGIREQIGMKYTEITNTIYKELEELKYKAQKDNYFTSLFIK